MQKTHIAHIFVPAYPQPPQFAPARFSAIAAAFSSSFTAQSLETKTISAAKTTANAATIPTTVKIVVTFIDCKSKLLIISPLDKCEDEERHCNKRRQNHSDREAFKVLIDRKSCNLFTKSAH